jgi:heme/copper-type cytochrome/quinol oxidase subunit 2
MKMKRQELLAGIVVLLVVVVLPVIVFYPHYFRKAPHERSGEILLVARTFERGGWSPAKIKVKKGERIKIRVLAEDVTHSFQLLHLGIETGPIFTGSSTVVEFTPDKTGMFPFYCNTRCSTRHENLMGLLIVEN